MKIQLENVYQANRHFLNLAELAQSVPFEGIPEIKGMQIYEKLCRLEAKAHRLAEISCNTGQDFEKQEAAILAKVKELLPNAKGLFLNGDPRGYALKMKEESAKELFQNGMNIYTDFGGYGILAPEF